MNAVAHAARELVERTTKAQNLPTKVTDGGVVSRVAAIVARQSALPGHGAVPGSGDRSANDKSPPKRALTDSLAIATTTATTTEEVHRGG